MKPLFVLRMLGLSLALAPSLVPHAFAQTAATAASQGYILGANDEIEVTVFGQPDLTVRTRIKSDGAIVLPLIGQVQATGKAPATLGQEIAGKYRAGGYLTNPAVNVEVASYVSRSATVLGNVLNSGNYALDHDYTVSSMVARAGGIRPDGANTVVLTPGDGSTPERIALTDLQGGAARIVKPGDTLFIPPAEMVYVYGQVNTPGAIAFQPDSTYRQILARAGGPTLAGSTRKIEVRRAGKKVSGLSLDDVAKPEDVLIIKEKLF